MGCSGFAGFSALAQERKILESCVQMKVGVTSFVIDIQFSSGDPVSMNRIASRGKRQ